MKMLALGADGSSSDVPWQSPQSAAVQRLSMH